MSIPPTVFYFSTPKLHDTRNLKSTDNLFSTIVECILYKDILQTETIGHFMATRIIYNEYGNGFGVTDGVYHIYDKNKKYGIIRSHNSVKSVLNEYGVVANKNRLELPIIQSTEEYAYLLPVNGSNNFIVIDIDEKGNRTATIKPKSDMANIYIQPTYNYVDFCTFRDFNSTYNSDNSITTQRFHLVGSIYRDVQDNTPKNLIGFLVSNMNVSNSLNYTQNSINCYTTGKDFFVKAAYFVNDPNGKAGIILGLIVSTNANFNSNGSVYYFYKLPLKDGESAVVPPTTVSSGSLICWADGDDFSYLNPQNLQCEPYKVIINTTNNVRNLLIPERITNADGSYKLKTSDIFKIALITYTKVAKDSSNTNYKEYITTIINNFKYKVYEPTTTINTITKIAEYIYRQKNAPYYVDPKDINSKNPFYSFIYQENETVSTVDFFKFSNKNVIQQNVIRKLFKNIDNDIVCEQLLERHIYTSGNGSTKSTGVITESSIYFNEDYWINIIGANMDDISASGDTPDGIYLMNALCRSIKLKANCIYYVVVDNLRMIVIPNTDFDFDSILTNTDVVIAGETELTTDKEDDTPNDDTDSENYTFYYKIDNSSSYDRNQLFTEYSFNTNLYAKMSKLYNLTDIIGLINCDSRLINLENKSFNFLNSFESFTITQNSYNIPEGNIQTHFTGTAVTSINGYNSNDGVYTHEILDTSNSYKYLSNKISQYKINITIINNSIRQIKIPKNKNAITNITNSTDFEKRAYITQHNYITNSYVKNNIDNMNKMVCSTVPVYLNLTSDGQPIKLCDFASIISFINPNDTTNKYQTCSTMIIQLSVNNQITLNFTDQCYLSDNGILTTNDQTSTQIIDFSIISATGDLNYLNPTNKLIKGFLELTDKMIVLNIPKKSTILIKPEELTFKNELSNYYISSLKISMVSIITEQLNTNGYFSYIYSTIEDAENNNREKNIGMYLSFNRIVYNTSMFKSVIFYSVYYIPKQPPAIDQIFITTHADTTATNTLGNCIKQIDETVISYSNHDDIDNVYRISQIPTDVVLPGEKFKLYFNKKPTRLLIRSKFPPRGWS